jgi:hypothetical protein
MAPRLATSLIVATSAVAMFALSWVAECPKGSQGVGVDCGILASFAYLALCPMLSVAALGFGLRDLARRELRLQAAVACLIGATLLGWYWTHPAH